MYYLSLHIGTETLGALQVGLLFHKSLSLSLHVLLSVCLQNCEKRRTIRRTALNNAISETSLPVTEYDTFFETPINTRRHTVDDDVRVALQQHGYWRVFSSIVVTNSFVFHISSFTYTALYILQIHSYSTARQRRTHPRASRRTTVAHHCILPYSICSRQFRTTSRSAQRNNSA